jgi:hypothetical protein
VSIQVEPLSRWRSRSPSGLRIWRDLHDIERRNDARCTVFVSPDLCNYSELRSRPGGTRVLAFDFEEEYFAKPLKFSLCTYVLKRASRPQNHGALKTRDPVILLASSKYLYATAWHGQVGVGGRARGQGGHTRGRTSTTIGELTNLQHTTASATPTGRPRYT